ncbi:hypothetical protein HAHE_43080 [Haloferula helveola]|uniref:Right handed beta helix domain-containing protein n=1 Tax=Haloferula helveola TaxID=490095 RepID=A0ABN6H9X6_9BACT|nr:hypothetical protein HAHE_43080 [Haloferula helveola]
MEEAKSVLGLGAEEDPVTRMGEFAEARERLADLVRNAPNETIATRYQEGLQEFDRAMAAVREEAERRRQEKVAAMMALVPGSVTGKSVSTKREDFHSTPVPPKKPVADPAPPQAESEVAPAVQAGPSDTPVDPEEEYNEPEPESTGLGLRVALYLMLFLVIGGAGGGWLYFHIQAEKDVRRQMEMANLERLAAKLVDGRSWKEAKEAYLQIEKLSPGSEVVLTGLRSIEFGMREEQEQFVGYWSGEALAAFEADRLDDAAAAAEKVLKKYPNESEVLELRDKIESARVSQVRTQWTEAIRAAVEIRNWEQAESGLSALAGELPGDELIRTLGKEIAAAKEKQQQEFGRARELAGAAKLRDQGAFDAQALEWMREAIALAPHDEEIRALYEKIASYTRTLRVPEDMATLKEALQGARDRDRVVLGEGVFEGGLAINVAVQLEGAGEGKTVLEAEAGEAPVITFGPGAKKATVSGVVFHKKGFDPAETRYPAVQLRGAEVSFADCVFLEASGHGLEVIESGVADALRCEFKGNGWDGAAAHGKDSRLVIRESRSTENYGHGFEVWDGGSASISECVAKGNSRAGILIDSAAEGIDLLANEVMGNREYGIVLAAGASGRVRGNSVYANKIGGMAVRFSAISMVVEKNRMEKNDGPGLILEQGLREDIYSDNVVRLNDGGNLVAGAQFEGNE